MRTPRGGSLEIDQDLEFERRECAVQRLGWLVGLLVLVAGFAGLLGPGPLSHVEASSGPLTLEYERFGRKHAPTELHVRLKPGVARDGQIAIWLDRAYLSKVAISHRLWAFFLPSGRLRTTGDSRLIADGPPKGGRCAWVAWDVRAPR